jgi:ABC-2 type transport system ATP-binding protein
MNAVEINNLRKVFLLKKGGLFNRQTVEVAAVHGIDLAVASGESVAFIGPNGAGKSTTIKILTGIMRPTEGTASVLGLIPWRDRTQLAYKIGAVFGQRSQLWYHLPPDDSFELLARIYNLPKSDYRKRRDMLIERFALGSFLQTPVRKLSLGQRMRAEIAASLLHAPQVIFLDEPTIGLDVIARQELRDLIREWNRDEGITVFLTSHDAGDIESVARRVIVINHGRVVLDDRVSNVRRKLLGTKVISAKFQEQSAPLVLPGVKVLEHAGYSMKLEVDTEKINIDQVTAAILGVGRVIDITIEDPPLEDVIAHIYNKQGHELAGESSSLLLTEQEKKEFKRRCQVEAAAS